MQEIAIEVTNLTKKIEEQTILNNVSLKVKKGEIYGLVGENGAGKSTLMKTMFHILKPTVGEVTILEEKITDNVNSVFQKVSTIIENPIFYQNLTVEENLDIHCDYVGTEYKEDINKVLTMAGLQNVHHKKVKELSLGMKQRLALGRAILCQPEILILDEPINGLDPKGIVDIRELLLTINKDLGVTIFISSHIIAELEKIVDTIGIIHGGTLIEEFSMEKAKNQRINLESHFLHILRAGEMSELMKIELKKINIRGQIRGLVIANVVILLLVIMFQLMLMVEQEGALLFPTNMVIDTLVKGIFLIWQAALIASLIVEEFRSKTLMQLYTYPINRKSLIQAKLVLICIIVLTFIIVTQAIQHILIFGLNGIFPFIQYHISIVEIVQLFFTSITAVMLGMFPLYIGLMQKSSVATIVSALIVVSAVTNTQGISGGLITILPISVLMGIIGTVFAFIAIKDVVKKDLII